MSSITRHTFKASHSSYIAQFSYLGNLILFIELCSVDSRKAPLVVCVYPANFHQKLWSQVVFVAIKIAAVAPRDGDGRLETKQVLIHIREQLCKRVSCIGLRQT